VWKIPVGEGHSSPVVVGGRVYLNSRVNDQEVVASYDIRSGKEIWKDSNAAPYTMNPAATSHGKGPKSTPVISDGRLYTLGISGTLSSYDISNGKLRWRKGFGTQFKQTAPAFGTAMSPVVDRGLLILHVGGPGQGALMALDASTGAAKWSWNGAGPAYASPIVVDVGGTRQIITQSQLHIVSISEADGQLLWKLPFKTDYEQNSVTPVSFKDMVIVSGLNQGVIALRPIKRAGQWAADQVWQNKEVSLYMSSPVIRADVLYGFSHRNKGQYFSLDANSGKTLWVGDGRQGENASLQLAGELLVTLDNEARLTVYQATARLTTPIRQYQVAQSPTWAHAVLLPGKVLVKSFNSLELLSLE
jgi:outer membrane protein assembly factor BamB